MTIILIVLIVLLLAGGGWGYYGGHPYATGPYNIIWVVLILFLVFAVFGGPRYGWW